MRTMLDSRERSKKKEKEKEKRRESYRASSSPRRTSYSPGPPRRPVRALITGREAPPVVPRTPVEDPRVDWKNPETLDVSTSLEEKIKGMIERAISKLAPPPQLQGSETECCTEPSLGLPASETHNVQSMSNVQMPKAADRRPICSPPPPVRSTVRGITSLGDRPADGAHRSPLSDLPYTQSVMSAMPWCTALPRAEYNNYLSVPVRTRKVKSDVFNLLFIKCLC